MFETTNFPTVNLTVAGGVKGQPTEVVIMVASRLLAYEQHHGFTRVRLTKGVSLDVREGTDEIDRRLREASAQLAANSHSRL
jgi:hypothetical protein